jgi:TonB family protein
MLGIVVSAVGQPHRAAPINVVRPHDVSLALDSVVTSLPETELSNHSAGFNLGIGRKEMLAASNDSSRAKAATQAHPEMTSDVSSEKTKDPSLGSEAPVLLNDSQNALAEPLVVSNSTQVTPIQEVNRNGDGKGVSLGTAQGTSSHASRSSRDAAGPSGAAVADSDAGLFGAIRGAIQRQVRYPSAARRAGLEGTVYVRLHFASDASTPWLEIARSSGHTDLDDAAVKAVHRSLPLPRPRTALNLTIPIVFQLR